MKELYLNLIKKVLMKNFKVEENKSICGEIIPLYGFWNEYFGRTFLGKDKIIDRFECNEHCIVKELKYISEDNINSFINLLKLGTSTLVKPHIEHKTTYVTGIVIYDNSKFIDESVKRKVRRFKYMKNYKLSIYGWSILRLVILDVQRGDVYYNKEGKELGEKIMNALKKNEAICV